MSDGPQAPTTPGELLQAIGLSITDIERDEPAPVYHYIDGQGLEGWLWVDDSRQPPVAHLSFLVLLDASEVKDLRRWVKRIPRPFGSSLDLIEEGKRASLRLVDRFKLNVNVLAVRRSYATNATAAHMLRSLASEATTLVGKEALSDLRDTLAEAGIAPPPIPPSIRQSLATLGRWCWTSALVNPLDMYMFEPFALTLSEVWVRTPMFALTHAGHGINSYGLNLAVAHGPVGAFVQHSYGGAYTDPVADLDAIAHTYARLNQLLWIVRDENGPVRWLLLYSQFRGVGELLDLEQWVPGADAFDSEGQPHAAIEVHSSESDVFKSAVAKFPGLYVGAEGAIDW